MGLLRFLWAVIVTTVAADDVTEKLFDCTGETIYPLGASFKFFNDTDLVVERITAAGVRSELTIGDDYSVSGGNGSTGTVTTVATYSDGELFVYRDSAIKQTYDAEQGDGFNSDTFEANLDRFAMMLAEMDIRLGNALQLSRYGGAAGGGSSIPDPEANKVLAANATATGFAWVDIVADLSGYAISQTPVGLALLQYAVDGSLEVGDVDAGNIDADQLRATTFLLRNFSEKVHFEDTINDSHVWMWIDDANEEFHIQWEYQGGGLSDVLTIDMATGNITMASALVVSGAITSQGANVVTEDALIVGEVNSAGGAISLPSGWTSARTALGRYTITHNLSDADYVLSTTPYTNPGNPRFITTTNKAADTFSIETTDATGTLQDTQFDFMMKRY